MKKKKRILFTGGGSAGHVIVNLALIPEFYKDGWEIDYIGSKEGIERKLIGELEYVTYHPISTGKLRRYMSLENIKDPFKVIKGTFQAWRIIGKLKPRIIFSKGGFVSVPVVVAAKLRRVPAVIHESDFTPGLANKLSIPFAKKILTTFPETIDYLPEKKSDYVGAVIREELLQGSKKMGLEYCGLTSEKPVILIMGGSVGSRKINQSVRECLPTLLESFQIIHICGAGNVDKDVEQKGYCQFEYVHDELKDIFACTDFVISRAGSNAIFEFLALNIPMLLIPLSLSASRGDQIVNAKSFVKKQYARVLEEEDLSNERLIMEISTLQKHAPVMRDAMKKYKSEKSRKKVIDILQANLT